MNFEGKGYIFIGNQIIPLEINEEMLKDNSEKYGNFEYHYQYLEFFCDYFGLAYDKSKSDNLVLYSNYLDYILTSNGYVLLLLLQNLGQVYDKEELPLFSKEKVQTKQTALLIVPYDKEIISEEQKENLKKLRKTLQKNTDLTVYSYEDEVSVFNGMYKEYNTDKYFDKVIENKKSRFRFR